MLVRGKNISVHRRNILGTLKLQGRPVRYGSAFAVAECAPPCRAAGAGG